jgi:exodeoxyribonuclease-5
MSNNDLSRDYFKEGRELELALALKGILNWEGQTLVELVDFYAQSFNTYGSLISTTSVSPAIASEPALVPVTVTPIELPKSAIPFEFDLKPASLVPAEPVITLSDDQQDAWDKLMVWLYNDAPYFVLRGYAGTGKSFLLKKLADIKGMKVYFSAPTNKATKVLGSFVGGVHKTTYSILGLRMEQIEDKLVLVPSRETPYFPRKSILVIDEASMCGSQLCEVVETVRKKCGIKILYVGDSAQLNPVGEKRSQSWDSTKLRSCRSILRQVMRYDNELLVLATELRDCIKTKTWTSPLESNHGETHGVWKYKNQDQFERKILMLIDSGYNLQDMKIIAWRNRTVDAYNAMVRRHLGYAEPYCVGELILLAEPVEKDGDLVAHTDDEYKIENIVHTEVEIDKIKIKVWRLTLKGDRDLVVTVPKDQSIVDSILQRKADFAKTANKLFRAGAWQDFWKTKALFTKIRYAYALTAHRAQGSSIPIVFCDQMDILSNRNSLEAFRCLYVACTRAMERLISF